MTGMTCCLTKDTNVLLMHLRVIYWFLIVSWRISGMPIALMRFLNTMSGFIANASRGA